MRWNLKVWKLWLWKENITDWNLATFPYTVFSLCSSNTPAMLGTLSGNPVFWTHQAQSGVRAGTPPQSQKDDQVYFGQLKGVPPNQIQQVGSNAGFPLSYVTGVLRSINIRIMPLVSKAKKCISLQKDRNVTVAESDYSRHIPSWNITEGRSFLGTSDNTEIPIGMNGCPVNSLPQT